ncbi:MAG: DsrE family protein [Xanthomonadales bacterium]|jgi:sulfur relay (sulfurtransferase) DsrF/TusC family protein|nr:DsrE family protein [Xanthomonadales bacterium]MDH3924936.1 DsrE family protein [Xanthomonadales bacterium]MDH3940152.1 DsrE family protein [Xanthomonadales bacterium]MDH4000723.1 DsrE family protein [Xanthomonadales bacterium]
MAVVSDRSLAMIVQSRPYQNRVARANIDLAMAAAAMEFELYLYFVGPAILQLAADQNSIAALLPPGYRAWSALPELAKTTVYAEQAWLDYCRQKAITLVMPADALDSDAIRIAWRAQQHAVVV